ncbi:MAG: methyltransferase family protein [Promethearchaeota archaeon]
MKLKGIEKWNEKLPTYQGRRILLIPALFIILLILGSSFTILLYISPSFFPESDLLYLLEPFLPFIGPLIQISIGLFLVSKVWSKRNTLLEQSREYAYQRGFTLGIFGIPLIITTAIHNYIPTEVLLLWQPLNPTTSVLYSSLLTVVPGWSAYELIIRIVLGLIFLMLGVLTILRAFFTFGIDYMAVVYLYYPEESELQNHQIYSVLRHPTYFGVILTAFGSCCMKFSVYSIFSFILVVVGMLFHINFVEEKELLERFGDSYRNYRKQTPALLIKPNQIGLFLKFIFNR